MSTQVVAEIGSVHDGSLGNALKLIELAAECGADAVKFQTHISEAETLKNAPAPPFSKENHVMNSLSELVFSCPMERIKGKM